MKPYCKYTVWLTLEIIMVKYQPTCLGSTLRIYNQLLHAGFWLVGYFYNVNVS